MKILLSAIALLASTSAFAFGPQQPTSNSAPKPGVKAVVKPAALKVVDVCPIMKHKVSDTKTALSSVYKGTKYYFCCAGCKPAFDKEPAKYASAPKPASAKPGAKG